MWSHVLHEDSLGTNKNGAFRVKIRLCCDNENYKSLACGTCFAFDESFRFVFDLVCAAAHRATS
jgi:hypothetical protein